jgi:hypothetical protein
MEPHWWFAQPLRTSLPVMLFSIDKKAPLLDNYQTDRDLDLFSERLITILRAAGVRFETFPANLIDYKTNDIIPVLYEVFHLLESYACADLQHSTDGLLTLSEDCLHRGRPFFRLVEAPQIVLIHRDLQATLEAAHVTGCQYTSLSEYQNITLYPQLSAQKLSKN